MLLIVGALLGYRRLRDVHYFQNDPVILRILGVRRMPTQATISRQLNALDGRSIGLFERLQRRLVLDALEREQLSRITLDFDGSVVGTCRHAEGVASGYNARKKGLRSYYPLNCTVAQTGQVLAVLHRSGNVHDSHGAEQFIRQCVQMAKNACPYAVVETRMDGAFFSEAMISTLDELGVQYTISVPFERYSSIKCHVEERRRWRSMRGKDSYFEKQISLKSWSIPRHRFIFIRQPCNVQRKKPLQLDLFQPYDFNYQYKAVVTSKITNAANTIEYHEGRGTQEGIFAELKSQMALGYVPCNRWNANKLYLLCNVLAHNLTRELQMQHNERDRVTTSKRPALWKFTQIRTMRKRIINRAGRLLRPQGVLTLSMAANDAVRDELMQYLPDVRLRVAG
jgi:hypothetical protein